MRSRRLTSGEDSRVRRSSRMSAILLAVREGTNPKSARKSWGKMVRWRMNRVGNDSPRRIVVSKSLERGPAPVVAVPDGCEHQALQDPGLLTSVRYAHVIDHRIAGRRPRGHRGRPREGGRRAVLDQPDHVAVFTVDLPPRPEFVLGVGHEPGPIHRLATRAGLPPHARPTRRRRIGHGGPGEVIDWRRHCHRAAAAAWVSAMVFEYTAVTRGVSATGTPRDGPETGTAAALFPFPRETTTVVSPW